MGENRHRIIWLENDVQELKQNVQGLRNELAEATDFSTDITAQNEAIEGLGDTIGLFSNQIQALGAQVQSLIGNESFAASQHVREWLSEMQHTCRQVKDSVTSIHAWQEQMAKDFSKAVCRINALADSVAEMHANRLKLASIADERISQFEGNLEDALDLINQQRKCIDLLSAQNVRGAVSRMETLETRLRKLEEAQVRVTFGPKTVHIPEAIHLGGPVSVKLDPPAKRGPDPRQIQCHFPLLEDQEQLDN